MYAKPFLKWAGNKYPILMHLQKLLPQGKRLIEPFVGSGALFLNTDYSDYLLNDSNADLISLYNTLKKFGKRFIRDTKKLFTPPNNSQEMYYLFREEFNAIDDPYQKSMLFVYLNRHSFNGLCRYNSRGLFNVPFGSYVQPTFPEEQLLQFYQRAKSVKFYCNDFRKILAKVKNGDIVYCDPPYVKLSETSQPHRYQANGFNDEDQIELARIAEEISKKGIPVLISNHDTDFTREIYQNASLTYLTVPRYISCKTTARVPAKELLALYT